MYVQIGDCIISVGGRIISANADLKSEQDQARVFGIAPKEEEAAQQQPGVVLQQYTLSTKPNNLLVGKRKHEGDDEKDPTEGKTARKQTKTANISANENHLKDAITLHQNDVVLSMHNPTYKTMISDLCQACNKMNKLDGVDDKANELFQMFKEGHHRS